MFITNHTNNRVFSHYELVPLVRPSTMRKITSAIRSHAKEFGKFAAMDIGTGVAINSVMNKVREKKAAKHAAVPVENVHGFSLANSIGSAMQLGGAATALGGMATGHFHPMGSSIARKGVAVTLAGTGLRAADVLSRREAASKRRLAQYGMPTGIKGKIGNGVGAVLHTRLKPKVHKYGYGLPEWAKTKKVIGGVGFMGGLGTAVAIDHRREIAEGRMPHNVQELLHHPLVNATKEELEKRLHEKIEKIESVIPGAPQQYAGASGRIAKKVLRSVWATGKRHPFIAGATVAGTMGGPINRHVVQPTLNHLANQRLQAQMNGYNTTPYI